MSLTVISEDEGTRMERPMRVLTVTSRAFTSGLPRWDREVLVEALE